MEIEVKYIAGLIDIPGLESELHMIRHFMSVSENLRTRLTENGFQSSEIENYLSIPGSRFYDEFAGDITQLLSKGFKYHFSQQIGDNGNSILSFNIPYSDYPEGIGTKSVISLAEIPKEEKAHIYTEKNRGVSLKHLKVKKLPSTNEFVLVVRPSGERFIFITAFPGSAAMPVPNHSMANDLYSKCKDFWDNHVFLVEG